MALYRTLLALGICPLLLGCDPAALALLGGASTLIRYNFEGMASRTFTAPSRAVKSASLAAAERMGLSLESTETLDTSEVIRMRAPNRDIEIELEPITEQATRVRIIARGGSFFYDNATATELVQQTEKLLQANLSPAIAPPAAAGASLPSRSF